MAGRGQSQINISSAGERLAREILIAYPQGVFPMAETRDDPDYEWYQPQMRGILPLDNFHISRSLSRFTKQYASELSFGYSQDFLAVVDACASRDHTWINAPIREAFYFLHLKGFAHSAEVFLGKKRIGGVYGLALGGAFFGESMFSKAKNGSKLALGFMVNDLRMRGYSLYDTQFLTPHLASLGGIEITQENYLVRLEKALQALPSPIPHAMVDNAMSYFLR